MTKCFIEHHVHLGFGPCDHRVNVTDDRRISSALDLGMAAHCTLDFVIVATVHRLMSA